MTIDYDAPRTKGAEDAMEDSLGSVRELARQHTRAESAAVDVDEAESVESLELPGADLSAEEFSVIVIPQQADEFTCSTCFLVHHRSQLAVQRHNQLICSECA